MKQILCSDCLPEWERWAYLAHLGLPALFPQKAKFFGVFFWAHNKSVIDQACSVQMAGYRPHHFCVFMVLDFVSVRKKELGQYSAILTSCLVNNTYILDSTTLLQTQI